MIKHNGTHGHYDAIILCYKKKKR